MTNNFNTPFRLIATSQFVTEPGNRYEFDLETTVTMLENYYGVGYIQLFNSIVFASQISGINNVGSVLNESAVRREFGTWHRENQSAVDARHRIEHPIQRFTWLGQRYPLERSRASDPGTLVLRDGINLDYVLEQDALIKADPISLTPLAVPIPPVPNTQTARFKYVPGVPQYRMDKACVRLRPENEKLKLNFIDEDNYRSLDTISLLFDSDKIVVRPATGVTIDVDYNAYILIASENTPGREFIGGGTQGVCIPILPVYAPEPPPDEFLTEQ